MFKNTLNSIPQADYPSHSRIHPLRSFAFPSVNCFVKREDELGFGISGSKIRKYSTLIPWLIQKRIQEVVLIGSASSNNVLGLNQLLIENKLKPTLFLRGDPSYSLKGNCLLSTLFAPAASIHWFSKTEWHGVQSKAEEYALKQPHPTFVLPEGAAVAASLPGALSLAHDIIKNERENGITFDHIFIEAGTGFMACALLLGLSWLKCPSLVHVLLLAEDELAFHRRLKHCHEMFLELMQAPAPIPQHFALHLPQLTGGFGKTPPFIFQFIKQLAQEEGFLTDPVYSGKLFFEAKRLLSTGEIKGNVLIIHSGGALSLMGFQEQLLCSSPE